MEVLHAPATYRLGWSFLLLSTVLALAGVLVAQNAHAADPYPFLVRGRIDSITVKTNRINVYITKTSAKATPDLLNLTTTFTLSGATLEKYEGTTKKTIKLADLRVGHQVVMRGEKSAGGSFKVTSLVINDLNFTVVGKVKAVDTLNKTITILIGNSTYKPTKFVNKEVKMQYTPGTKCMRRGTVIDCEDVAANSQVAKMQGDEAKESLNWVLTKFWDSYK